MRLDFDGEAVSDGDAAIAGVLLSIALPEAAPGAASAAPAPHSALRKSFQLMPLRVLAACAARYLTLHSCMLKACAGMFQVRATKAAVAQSVRGRIDIAHELHAGVAFGRHRHDWPDMESKRRCCWQRKTGSALYSRRTKSRSFKIKT